MHIFTVRALFSATAIIGAIAATGAASAAENGSQSFAVRAHVAESCEINASTILTGNGAGFAAGSVFESCNTQEGFQVVAQHRWLEQNERVMFNYAGQTNFLQHDGWSHVATRLGAKFGTRPISVRYDGLTEPLSIGLTITAL